MTDDHPAVQALSAFLDGVLSPDEATAVRDHLAGCLECSRELERLDMARRVLLTAGLPPAPSGAVESAVAAALASGGPALSTHTTRSNDGASASGDTAGAKQPEGRRHLYAQVVAQAAVALLVLGAIGGGVYGVMRASNRGSSSSAPAGPAFRATNPTRLGSLPHAHMQQPPVAAFALQLRPSSGPASCARAFKPEVASVDGRRVVVNPATTTPAVVEAPAIAGQPRTCIAVAPAFASVWSADISHVTIEPVKGSSSPAGTTAAGRKVDLEVALASDAVTGSVALDEALNGKVTVEVIAQGIDLGPAVVTPGPVVTLPVSPSTASFLRAQLLAPGGSSG